MGLPSLPQLIIVLVLFLLIVLPVILVLGSNRSSGSAKFGWFVATLVFSWVGYLVFLNRTNPISESSQ